MNYKIRICLMAIACLGFTLQAVAAPPRRANTEPLAPRYDIQNDGSVSLTVCYDSSCAGERSMLFTREDMAVVQAQLETCELATQTNNPKNRDVALQRLRIGVWQMELLAKKYFPPLGNDLPANDQEFGVEGRTDCVDNTTNTTTFLHILSELGWLPGWSVISPAVRKPWHINRVHWTAVVKNGTGERWSVDSWYRRHGHLPFVMPLVNWQREERAWDAPHQQINRYPKLVSQLCE